MEHRVRLTSLADYAVLIMRTVAGNCGGLRANAALLAQATGVPAPTAQKLIGQLSRSGLLKATRGHGGGVKLARPAAAISLADIVEAVEGPIALTACLETVAPDCGCALGSHCAVRPHWQDISARLRATLADISLASLLDSPAQPASEVLEPAL
jgi:Rrf2 family protein